MWSGTEVRRFTPHSHATGEHQGAELVPTIFLITSTPASVPLNFVAECLLIPIELAPQHSYLHTMVLPTKIRHRLTMELDMHTLGHPASLLFTYIILSYLTGSHLLT